MRAPERGKNAPSGALTRRGNTHHVLPRRRCPSTNPRNRFSPVIVMPSAMIGERLAVQDDGHHVLIGQVSLVELAQLRGTGLDERPGHGRPRQPDRPGNRLGCGLVVAARNPIEHPRQQPVVDRALAMQTRRRTAAESRRPRHDESVGREWARAAPRGPPSPDCCRDDGPRSRRPCGHTGHRPTPSLRRRASLLRASNPGEPTTG